MKCRRCSECAESSHHWIANSHFVIPEFGEESFGEDAEFVCKHCDAIGNECPSCFGDGLEIVNDDPCPQCNGEGVLQIGGAS